MITRIACPSRGCRIRHLLFLLAAGTCLVFTSAAGAQDRNDDRNRIFQRSSPRVLAAFRRVVAGASQSTVRIKCDGKEAALGTVVGADGWILTKASELTGKIVCQLKNGREFPARLIKTADRYDLALLRVNAEGLEPVVWKNSKTAPVGNWVASPGLGREPVAVGVVSVAARRVPEDKTPWVIDPDSGYLGIGLEPSEGGAKVGQVVTGAAADKAGLKVNDRIVSVETKTVKDPAALLTALKPYKPGDVVRLRVRREGKEVELKVKLDKRPHDRADFQEHLGSVLSKRRKNFPTILQHDTVLKPSDCGGPIVDLDGNVIGINIARAGRTESYAVPSEAVLPILRRLSAGKLEAVTVPKKTSDLVRQDK